MALHKLSGSTPAASRGKGGQRMWPLLLAGLLCLSCHSSGWLRTDTPRLEVARFYYSSWLKYAEDYYKYHPARAFDGDPHTAWLEGSPGPGIGDYLGIGLRQPVTIDTILFMPGYFDARWFGNNNRIKTLLVQFDTESRYLLKFSDVMKPQQVHFPEPVTFHTVLFLVREVYPSGVDDDTALAEVHFFYQDTPLAIDLGRVEKYLGTVTAAEATE